MNKKIIISVVIVLIFIVIGVWFYLFLSGDTSKTNDTFAEFADGGDSTEIPVSENEISEYEEYLNEIKPKRLRQLTFRPVAGATFIESGILYVEQGTGHIFNINIDTGNETLVSGTTLPKTRNAVFSKDGTFVAITNYVNNSPETLVGSISPTGELDGVFLPPGATEVSFSNNDNDVLYYITRDSDGSRGYSYDIELAKSSELFSIPLRDIRVIWGEKIYAYTTPTSKQMGYIYEIVGNNLEYVTEGSLGLLAWGTNGNLLVTKVIGPSVATKPVLENKDAIFRALMPEKCTSYSEGAVCAIPETIDADVFPDAWYKGAISFSDSLWRIGVEEGGSAILSDLLQESGREIDVIKIGSDVSGKRFHFINKNDNSLWLFDRTI